MTLAPYFATLFFPPGNETAALVSAFATYAAAFLVRPFGAIVFGWSGDLVGWKYPFLVAILFMLERPSLLACCPHTRRLVGLRTYLAGFPVVGARLGARWRVRRCGCLRRRVREARQDWLRHELYSNQIDTRFFPGTSGYWRLPRVNGCQDVRGMGLADPALAVVTPAGVLGLHPAETT